MPMSPEALDHLAWLARLELKDAERARLTRDLEQILAYVRVLETVATEGVAPFGPAPEGVGEMRADEVVPGVTREAALANAPETAAEFFALPAVVERSLARSPRRSGSISRACGPERSACRA
jgi:aspartyl-tRNA(Asn)/glutamyl-tRNA(Gln) amidotransferase subunit C